jgi:Replication factor RFC1 C terminal domain
VVWPEFEAKQTPAAARGCPNSYAAQGVWRQGRDSTILHSSLAFTVSTTLNGIRSGEQSAFPKNGHLWLTFFDPPQSVVDEVIECMDGYYLSKDEWDTVVELGVGDSKDDKILKKISTATKTAFTKKY